MNLEIWSGVRGELTIGQGLTKRLPGAFSVLDPMGEQGQEPGALAVVRHDVLPGIAPTRQMTDGAGEIQDEAGAPWDGSLPR